MVDAAENASVAATAESRRAEAKKTLPWIEKYRPATLADLVSHEDIVKTRTLHYFHCLPTHSCVSRALLLQMVRLKVHWASFLKPTVSNFLISSFSSPLHRSPDLFLVYLIS